MTDCILGKHVSEPIFAQLEDTQDTTTVERILVAAFDLEYLDIAKRRILLKLYIRNYGFCRSQAFSYEKCSTFLSLMHDLIQRDSRLHSDEVNISSSHVYFEELLLKHSVERSPKSTKIFERGDVPLIYDYVMNQYYQHFKMYQYIFGVQAHVYLQQTTRNDIDEPAYFMPQLI